MKGRVGDAEKEFAATQARLAQERSESETATRELGDARGRVENLSQRVTDLDRQLIVQVKEAEMLGSRVNDLEARLATQGKLLAEREYENNQLRSRPAKWPSAPSRNCAPSSPTLERRQSSPAIEKLRAEKAAVEEQLRIARDERAKLQRDINAIQQQAESSWATERMENALLRERINDIAAEVAKLAMQLEGPNSADRGHAGGGTGDPGQDSAESPPKAPRTARRQAAACPKAAERSPIASAPCNPTPPAPASRARNVGIPAALA